MAWALGKSQKPATLSKDFLLDIRESREKKSLSQTQRYQVISEVAYNFSEITS